MSGQGKNVIMVNDRCKYFRSTENNMRDGITNKAEQVVKKNKKCMFSKAISFRSHDDISKLYSKAPRFRYFGPVTTHHPSHSHSHLLGEE